MRWCRLLAALLVLTVLLAAGLAQPPGKPPPSANKPPAKPAKADPAADEALKKALDNLSPRRANWLETTIWEQLDVQGLTFQADGSYILGPRQQMKLDLKVRVGGANGRLREISDGKTLWEVTEIGTQPAMVKKVDLGKVLQILDAPTLQQAKDDFLQSESFAGPVPLLNTLRKSIMFTEKRETHWRDKDIILLSGNWANLGGDPKQWPDSLPRRCQLYLDRETYWPYRLEWWGPSAGRKEDVLLMQIEFRDPTHPDQVPAREFAFDPKSLTPPAAQVVDQTEMYENLARKRASMGPARSQ